MKHIIDGMKKERKPFRNIMIFGYIFAILMPLSIFLSNNEKYSQIDAILFMIIWFMFGTFGLYGWLYATKYRLEITKNKVMLKTLFKKVDINIKDIINYTCNRYKKSEFYQFMLYTKDKKVLINTRYKDKFIEILNDNNITEIVK